MPLKKREQSSTNLYHIISRGNNKNWIFKSEQDKDKFLEILYKHAKADLELYAWCVMNNHVHIVLQMPFDKLSIVMGKINFTYSMYYQRQYNHNGHVFQGRFLSEPINTEEYLLQVIKYVHNNPMKAKMINYLGEYQWSSYRWFLKKHSSRLTIDIMGAYFGNNESDFLRFHQLETQAEIMDTRDELKQREVTRGEKIISQFCQNEGIEDRRNMLDNERQMIRLIQEIAKSTKLTNRQISKLTHFPYELIKSECKRIRKG